MKKNRGKCDNRFSEISNVESLHDSLIPEEFPEGPVGSPINAHKKVESKSTEWEKGQQRTSAFTYADKEQHNDLPRRTPGAHPLHDE
jgi:hypothetical protein